MSYGFGFGFGIGSGSAQVWDADVLAFIAAQSITSSAEKNALNGLILSLKGGNSLGKNFYNDVVYLNTVSPTSLAVAKNAFKYPTTQGVTAIGTDGTHSADGVLFNGSTQGWDLNNSASAITKQNFWVILGRSNTITVSGTEFGANDVTTTNQNIFYPRSAATSGFLTGTSHGTLASSGLYYGGNDGTNTVIYKDGVKITPSAETARPTGALSTKDSFDACRNNNATAASFVDVQRNFNMWGTYNGTPYTASEIAVLMQIIQTYNENVV